MRRGGGCRRAREMLLGSDASRAAGEGGQVQRQAGGSRQGLAGIASAVHGGQRARQTTVGAAAGDEVVCRREGERRGSESLWLGLDGRRPRPSVTAHDRGLCAGSLSARAKRAKRATSRRTNCTSNSMHGQQARRLQRPQACDRACLLPRVRIGANSGCKRPIEARQAVPNPIL